jgi:anti-sigma regulatory factor (Ser/Thr protein kinase)
VSAERTAAVPAEAAQLAALTQFLRDFWSDQGLPSEHAPSFELALEEIFVNVVTHGAPQGQVPEVAVTLSLRGRDLSMTLEDDGPHFDPLCLPTPDVTAALSERRQGGLGIFLVRELMDDVSYERVATRNRLTMSKHL